MSLRDFFLWLPIIKLTVMSEPTYEQLRAVYEKRFTLGYLNMDINNKFALISLVGYLTMKVREKSPTATHLSVLNKINADLKLPQDFINALAIVCEDFSYGCKQYPTFGIKDKDIISTIKSLLNKWVPF